MAHGGKRPGSGPKSSPSPYGEATKVVRIPASRVEEVRAYLKATQVKWSDTLVPAGVPMPEARRLSLPLFAGRVPAGFPSPAQDYIQDQLDLNQFLVEHEAATFYVQVQGNSMVGAGIQEGDILVVDRALEARHGDIVIAVIDNELTVKELYRANGQVRLLPHNPDFAPIEFKEGQELTIWGVVNGVVRKVR